MLNNAMQIFLNIRVDINTEDGPLVTRFFQQPDKTVKAKISEPDTIFHDQDSSELDPDKIREGETLVSGYLVRINDGMDMMLNVGSEIELEIYKKAPYTRSESIFEEKRIKTFKGEISSISIVPQIPCLL